jgi:hypothetical protein
LCRVFCAKLRTWLLGTYLSFITSQSRALENF